MGEAKGKLILITGGARSGKSTFAERYAAGSGKKVIYLATAAGGDAEMRRRIAEHKKRRPAHFYTIEEPYYPHRILRKKGDRQTLFLLDCLTLLLTNHLLKKEAENSSDWPGRAAAVLEYIESLADTIGCSVADVVIVTNEVGWGLVPENALGRVFRDLAGKANQLVAEKADEVWLMVCGIAQRIK